MHVPYWESLSIKDVMVGDKPYFVGKDIAEALGYARATKAIQDNCKGVLKRNILANGGNQQMSVIPEGDDVLKQGITE